MKRSLLLFLASLLATFALTGCAENSNNTPAPQASDVPDNLSGTYRVAFFGSQMTNVRSGGHLLP